MKQKPVAVAALLGAAFFLISWVLWTDGRHFIDSGDIFFPLDQIVTISKVAHIWTPDQLGSITYNISVLPLRGAFALLALAGISSIDIERLFLAMGYAVAAAGMYLCAREFWRANAAPLVAAIWYPCSITYCLAVPNENNVVAFAILPVLVFLALRAIDDLAYVIPFAIATMLFGFVAANPPTLVLLVVAIAVFWLIGAYGRSSPRRIAATAGWLFAAAALANFWWVPATKAALAANALVAPSASDWSWTLARTNLVSVIEQTSFWGFGSGSEPWLTLGQWYLHGLLPHTAIALTPILAFSALCFPAPSSAVRLRIAALTVVSVIAVLLSKGEAAPFASIGAWLYATVPGMFLYREPVKFLFVLAFALPLLAAAAYGAFAAHLSRWARFAAMFLFLGVPVVTGWALLSGWAFSIPQAQERIEVPTYWRDATQFLNKQDGRAGRVLLLPEDAFYQAHYTWGLNGVDRIAESSLRAPVIRLIADQNTYLENAYGAGALQVLDTALRAQRGDWIRNEFARLSIGYVVVRGDLVPDGRIMSLPEVRLALRLAHARHIAQFGPLEIYEVHASPLVAAPAMILRSCASPSAEQQLAMRLPADVGIIRSYTAQCRRNAHFLQLAKAPGVLARAGAIVVKENRSTRESVRTLRAQTQAVPMRWRFASETWRPAKFAGVPAAFCGTWHLQHTKDGWTAHRCVAVNDAAYITFIAPPYTAQHFPASVEFRWRPDGYDSPEPLDTALLVSRGNRLAEVSLVPGPLTTGLASIRAAASAMRVATVLAMQHVAAGRAPYFRVDRPLRDTMVVDGLDSPAEFVYRLPSGVRISAFVESVLPQRFVPARLFERAYQTSPLSARALLRRDDVVLEGVLLPFAQRTSVMPQLTLIISPNRWSVSQLRHDERIVSTSAVQAYTGRIEPLPVTAVNYTTTPLWTRARVRTDRAGWLCIRQAYSDLWAMPQSTVHAVFDGYGDAWYVPRAGTYEAFVPLADTQRFLYVTAAICLLIFCGLALYYRRIHAAP